MSMENSGKKHGESTLGPLRLAARAVFGIARTGSSYTNGSGDYAIAFSTSPEMRFRFRSTQPTKRRVLPTDAVSPLLRVVLEAGE
jgi:D-aminopeptidase